MNAYVNEVIFGDTTLISLKNDTVSESDVRSGVTFHKPSGEQGTGTLASAYVTGSTLVLPNSTVVGSTVIVGE